jgi:hypothetical protein
LYDASHEFLRRFRAAFGSVCPVAVPLGYGCWGSQGQGLDDCRIGRLQDRLAASNWLPWRGTAQACGSADLTCRSMRVFVLGCGRFRLSAAGQDAPANVSRRRYLTLASLPNGWLLYLGT